MVHIRVESKRMSGHSRESFFVSKANILASQNLFRPSTSRKKVQTDVFSSKSSLENDLRDFLKFNVNDFMFINSHYMESLVLQERSFTLVLFILNFLAILINVLLQEVV